MRDRAKQAINDLQIGLKLKYWRTQVRHWTLEELSKKTKLSKPLLSQIENGLVTPPLDTLYILCEALGVSFPDLLRGPVGEEDVNSRFPGESALIQIEDGLAQLKTAFEDMKQLIDEYSLLDIINDR